MNDEIQLLQFMICKDFQTQSGDGYLAEFVRSNMMVPDFPYTFGPMYAVTCWRKDRRFHKEVIEYTTDDGVTVKSPHMDIEPVTDSVLFRWHKHPFPSTLVIEKPTLLHVKVILDWKVHFESYLMIEKQPV